MCHKIVGLELDHVSSLQDKSNDHVAKRTAVYAYYLPHRTVNYDQ